MIRKTKVAVLVMVSIALVLSAPLSANADPSVDITPLTGVSVIPGFPMDDTNNNMYAGGWMTPGSDITYTVTFSGVADSSKILVSLGNVQSVSRTSDDNTVTVVIKSIDLYRPDSDRSITGLIAAIGSGPSDPSHPGPPTEAKGMYISTNAYDWQIRPSEFDRNGKPKNFIIRLNGQTGTAGFFKWFWPQTLMDFMGVTTSTLAGFIDNDQVSMNTRAVEGGALITIRLTYSTKTIKTARALPLSLATRTKRVSRNSEARLFGWLTPRRSNKKIALFRKFRGEEEYTRIATLTTRASGYFSGRVRALETGSYYVTARIGGRTRRSPVKTITVR